MLSAEFDAALDRWCAGVSAIHDPAGLDRAIEDPSATVESALASIADLAPGNQADSLVARYMANQWRDIRNRAPDPDANVFWPTDGVAALGCSALRLLATFQQRGFSAGGWIDEWEAIGGVAVALREGKAQPRILIGSGGTPRLIGDISGPNLAELRLLLLAIRSDDPAHARAIDREIVKRGILQADVALVMPTIAKKGRIAAHA